MSEPTAPTEATTTVNVAEAAPLVVESGDRSTDPWVIRAVVLILGTIAIESLGIAAWLSSHGREVDDLFKMAVAGSLSAIGALLASTSTRR